MSAHDVTAETIAWLRTPRAIRSRCNAILELARAGGLDHFEFREEKLAGTAAFVVETIRTNYPRLDIPYHSRWRHFSVGGRDRWASLAKELPQAGAREADAHERARVRSDLAVTSVLLDAGAGGAWRYAEPGGASYARSEGLAVASFHLFRGGAFSADARQPLRADAAALANLAEGVLAEGFQVSHANPLAGLEGRCGLLRRLGAALVRHPRLFGAGEPRIGNLFDALLAAAGGGPVAAPDILRAVLEGFADIWPGRLTVNGENLGDVWPHPKLGGGPGPNDETAALVPFHKLSQWLTYSLIEPLEEAGVEVVGIDELTGLAEYRNGGLLIDTGLLAPRHDAVTGAAHEAGSEIVVEWRALTVAGLDMIAGEVRRQLGLDAKSLPLVKVLEGGTWAAGRRIAARKRPGGGPPIRLISDGTVF